MWNGHPSEVCSGACRSGVLGRTLMSLPAVITMESARPHGKQRPLKGQLRFYAMSEREETTKMTNWRGAESAGRSSLGIASMITHFIAQKSAVLGNTQGFSTPNKSASQTELGSTEDINSTWLLPCPHTLIPGPSGEIVSELSPAVCSGIVSPESSIRPIIGNPCCDLIRW